VRELPVAGRIFLFFLLFHLGKTLGRAGNSSGIHCLLRLHISLDSVRSCGLLEQNNYLVKTIDRHGMNRTTITKFIGNCVCAESFKALRKSIVRSFLCASLLLPASYVSADDISAITPIKHKPNVLLVLDYSNSMQQPLNGEIKIDSLRTAVHGVIDQFSSEINIGIGPLFRQESGGIVWPISDLSQPANFVDPAITDLSITGRDVVKDIVC